MEPTALAYRLEDAARRIGLGKTKFRELLDAGEIKSFSVGTARLVTEDELRAYLRRQVEATQPEGHAA